VDVSDESRLRRLARRTGALAAVASLAGCPAQSGDGDDAGGGSEGATGGEGGADPAQTATQAGESDPTTTTTATSDCESRVADRQSELDALDGRIATAEQQLKHTRETAAAWEAKRGELPDGHPQERLDAAKSVAADIRESVVVINAGRGLGTGWFVGDGLVMTNAHNIAQFGRVASDITGYTLDGTELTFEVVEYVENNSPDVALLRTGGTTRPALALADSSDLEPGTPLVMVGHPGGVGHWVVSLGLYVRKSNDGDGGAETAPSSDGFQPVPSLLSSVPGRQGNSGSPMVTMDGEVVAMLNGSQTRDQDSQNGRRGPTVAEPFVYDWPASPRAWSVAVPVELVREKYSAWA
jgi:serine protease Do